MRPLSLRAHPIAVLTGMLCPIVVAAPPAPAVALRDASAARVSHGGHGLEPVGFLDSRTGQIRAAPTRSVALRGAQIAYDNFTSVTGGLFTTNVAITPQPCETDPNCSFDPNNLFVWFAFAGSDALDPFAAAQAACGDPNLGQLCHYDQVHDDYQGHRAAFGLGPTDPIAGVTRDLSGFRIAVWNNATAERTVCLLIEFSDPNGAFVSATNGSSPCFTLPGPGWWNLNATFEPNLGIPVPAAGFVGVDFFNTAFDANGMAVPLTGMGWLFGAGRVGGVGATIDPNAAIALGQSFGNFWIQTTSNTAGEMLFSPGVLQQSLGSGDVVNFGFLDPNSREFSHNLPVQIQVKAPAPPPGTPDWFDFVNGRGFRKDLPDFYQHQYWCEPNLAWEAGGGWCAPTAFANCMYSFKVNGYPNLLMNAPDIDDPNEWLVQSCLAILELRPAIGNIQGYLNGKGYGERECPDPNGRGGGLKYTQYVVDQTNGNVTYTNAAGDVLRRRGNAFSIYKKELKDGQDVLLRFAADPRRPGLAADDFDCLWWSGPNFDGGNYHFVTGAGVDCGTDANPKMTVYFADPDSNKGNAKADSGWPNPADPNYLMKKAALLARKYDGNDPIPIPARGVNMRADPVNFAQYYDCQEIAADGYTIETAGKYHNVRIRRIDTICPVKAAPKPSTPTPSGPRRPFFFDPGRFTEFDAILIYPIGADVVPFSLAPTADPNFFDPSGDIWLRSYVPAGLPDPDGNIRSQSGVRFETSGALSPGEMANGALVTNVDFNNYDVLVRAKGVPDPNDAWYVQPIGGPTDPFVETVLPGQVGCIGDVDFDGDIDLSDLSGLLGVFGTTVGDPNYLPSADFDNSGTIDLADLAGLLSAFGTSCL